MLGLSLLTSPKAMAQGPLSRAIVRLASQLPLPVHGFQLPFEVTGIIMDMFDLITPGLFSVPVHTVTGMAMAVE
jgi:hypothetical protein